MPIHEATSNALAGPVLRDIRALLDEAFPGDFSDDDWTHALGGVHVWVSGPDRIISHGSLVERTLVCAGRTLRVGYVEAVATAAAHRRHGHGATVMRRIGDLIRERHPLGALSTGAHAFYERLGWQRWRGATFVNGQGGLVRTPDDDGDVLILTTPSSPPLDLGGDLVADWRPGDVW
jgi:aminoglycoside 2'-N-acetyltransferase I